MKKYLNSWLLGIILLATVLRLWNLASAPPALTWDEAALGYNSYSILHTGKDEYGNLLPITLKSFGDYKPAVYAYLDLPFVAIFGLNEVSVRLPSVVFGVLAVWLAFLLVMELFENRRLAICVGLMLAISPLALQFSRPAFESNIAFTLNLAGVLFFLKGIKRQSYFLWSFGFMALSLFTYQSSRLFIPVMFTALLILYRHQIKFDRKFKIYLGVWVAILVISAIDIVGFSQSDRLEALNVFAYPRKPEYVQMISNEDGWSISSWQFQLLHGEWFSFLTGIAQRYLLYFSPKMLFVDGDVSFRNRVPDLGLLYYFSALLVPLGLSVLLKLRQKGVWVILLYLLLSPIPAIFSRDLINIIRAYNLLLPLTFLEGAGLYLVISAIEKFKSGFKWLGFGFLGLVMLINAVIFFDRYFIHAPIEYSEGWLYGYKQLYSYLDTLDLAKYQNIIITDKYGQPYIFYLFYHQYSPEKYQAQASLEQKSVDVGTVRQIDKYQFRWVDRWADRDTKKSLLVAAPIEIGPGVLEVEPEWKLLKEIKYLDGTVAFRIIETK